MHPCYRLKLKYPLPFSISYVQLVTAVLIKKCSKSTSVIKVVTMKNTDDFLLHKGSHHVQPSN